MRKYDDALDQLHLRVTILESLLSVLISRGMPSTEIAALAEIIRANVLRSLQNDLGDLSSPTGQAVVDVVMAEAQKVVGQALAFRVEVESRIANQDAPRH